MNPPIPLPLCDDLCDASNDALAVINARIALDGLELVPESFEVLRSLLCEALKLAKAQEVMA